MTLTFISRIKTLNQAISNYNDKPNKVIKFNKL